MSSPRVATLDNKAAEISQGIEIPFTTATKEKIETQSIDYLLKLMVTPHVTSDDSVDAPDRSQEGLAVDHFFRGGYCDACQGDENATTEVLVRDGETTVIGGIITDTTSETKSGIPWFHKIPFIGWMFQKKFNRVGKDGTDHFHHAEDRSRSQRRRAVCRNVFAFRTAGESHGPGLTVLYEGVPAGVGLTGGGGDRRRSWREGSEDTVGAAGWRSRPTGPRFWAASAGAGRRGRPWRFTIRNKRLGELEEGMSPDPRTGGGCESAHEGSARPCGFSRRPEIRARRCARRPGAFQRAGNSIPRRGRRGGKSDSPGL